MGRFLAWIGEKRIQRGERFFRLHGGKSIVLIRFLYGFRYAGAVTAGMMRMRFRRFFFYNCLAALLWSGLFAGLGYFFAHGWESLIGSLKYTRIGMIAVLAVGIFIWGLSHLKKRRLSMEANRR
jgi:undecaprenyl-diphosphatase